MIGEKVMVKINGHQVYREIRGTVLSVCQAVEHYGDKPLQVPALVMEINGAIVVQPLQQEGHWFEVKRL